MTYSWKPINNPCVIHFLSILILPLLLNACSRQEQEQEDLIMKTLRERHVRHKTTSETATTQLPEPSRVTLNGRYTAGEAIRSIQKQTDHKLALNDDSEPDQKASFELQNATFWKTVLAVRDRFGLYLAPAGDVILFENGLPRRSPVHIIGSLLISRTVKIRKGSDVLFYIEKLKSNRSSVQSHAYEKLQQKTDQDLPPDYNRWKEWFKRKGKGKYPPPRPLHRNRILLEAWLEPGHSMPWVERPSFRLISKQHTIENKLLVETSLTSSNRFGWQFIPPINKASGQKMKGEGTFFYSFYTNQTTLRLPVHPERDQTRTTNSPFKATFKKSTVSERTLTGTLTIEHNVKLSKKDRKALETVREKRKDQKLVYVDQNLLNRYRDWHKKVGFRLKQIRIQGNDTDASAIHVRSTPEQFEPSRSWDLTVHTGNQKGQQTLLIKLDTELRTSKIPFLLEPLYVHSSSGSFQRVFGD